METIEINGKSYLIDIEKAIEQGLLKEKNNRPRSWKEYEKSVVGGFVPNTRSKYYLFNSEDEARAFCALGKLIQLRDAWWGDWRPDWKEDDTEKFNIFYALNKIHIDVSVKIGYILSFPTEEMADDFLLTFRDLIEQAKMFL